MKNKVIIFGATGAIGAYTAIELKDKYDIVAVGRRKSDNGFFASHNIPYYSVDISDKENFSKIKEDNIYAVIHLAGAMPANMEGYKPEMYVDSIVKGTLNILNFCVENNVNRIVFGQSHADSGYLMGKKPIPSDIVKKFPLTGDHSVYSICKNAAVDLMEHFYHQHHLKRFVLRFPTVYTYHPNPFYHVNGVKRKMAFRHIMDEAIQGNPIEIWGNPKNKKENVYIKDAIHLMDCCLKADVDGGVYNLGQGIGTTLEDQILGIVKVFCSPDKVSEVTYRPEKPSVKEYINDISKPKKELGYNPTYTYEKLLVDYKKYYDEEPFRQLWGTKEDYK